LFSVRKIIGYRHEILVIATGEHSSPLQNEFAYVNGLQKIIIEFALFNVNLMVYDL